jgi:hypothetical protein
MRVTISAKLMDSSATSREGPRTEVARMQKGTASRNETIPFGEPLTGRRVPTPSVALMIEAAGAWQL